ncbi:MAG: dihydrofolate reductase [Spirochaetaceae bacterium]|jgi:dihydrofolate reductase|nr:dihydrofolate reductase [Spirochaetaceae bacterium]
MNLIVAVDNNWCIGSQGNLLFSIPEDMQYFKKLTETKVVIMGHSTLKSLPHGKPLKNRTNIILSRNKDLNIDNAVVCHSVAELLSLIGTYNADDVFVIGGQMIYELLLDYCHAAYVTKINAQGNGDTWFPNIDNRDNWELADESEEKQYNDITYRFTKYLNKKVLQETHGC